MFSHPWAQETFTLERSLSRLKEFRTRLITSLVTALSSRPTGMGTRSTLWTNLTISSSDQSSSAPTRARLVLAPKAQKTQFASRVGPALTTLSTLWPVKMAQRLANQPVTWASLLMATPISTVKSATSAAPLAKTMVKQAIKHFALTVQRTTPSAKHKLTLVSSSVMKACTSLLQSPALSAKRRVSAAKAMKRTARAVCSHHRLPSCTKRPKCQEKKKNQVNASANVPTHSSTWTEFALNALPLAWPVATQFMIVWLVTLQSQTQSTSTRKDATLCVQKVRAPTTIWTRASLAIRAAISATKRRGISVWHARRRLSCSTESVSMSALEASLQLVWFLMLRALPAVLGSWVIWVGFRSPSLSLLLFSLLSAYSEWWKEKRTFIRAKWQQRALKTLWLASLLCWRLYSSLPLSSNGFWVWSIHSILLLFSALLWQCSQ